MDGLPDGISHGHIGVFPGNAGFCQIDDIVEGHKAHGIGLAVPAPGKDAPLENGVRLLRDLIGIGKTHFISQLQNGIHPVLVFRGIGDIKFQLSSGLLHIARPGIRKGIGRQVRVLRFVCLLVSRICLIYLCQLEHFHHSFSGSWSSAE